MSQSFLNKTRLLTIVSLLFLFSNLNAQCVSSSGKIKVDDYLVKENLGRITITLPDTTYYIIDSFPSLAACDTIIRDSVIYMKNSCGTCCQGVFVIFLWPKLKWQYFSDVYAIDYKNGLVARCNSSFYKIYVQRVYDRKVIFYRTLGFCNPFETGCLPAVFFNKIILNHGKLTIYLNPQAKKCLLPYLRNKEKVTFKLKVN